MSQFDEREKSYEAKYSRDQEHDFKVVARRNKLLGLWAAEQMGITDSDAQAAYAREVIEADFEKPGHEDVVEKVLTDLTAKGVETSDHLIRKEMERLLRVAKEQIDQEA